MVNCFARKLFAKSNMIGPKRATNMAQEDPAMLWKLVNMGGLHGPIGPARHQSKWPRPVCFEETTWSIILAVTELQKSPRRIQMTPNMAQEVTHVAGSWKRLEGGCRLQGGWRRLEVGIIM